MPACFAAACPVVRLAFSTNDGSFFVFGRGSVRFGRFFAAAASARISASSKTDIGSEASAGSEAFASAASDLEASGRIVAELAVINAATSNGGTMKARIRIGAPCTVQTGENGET